MKFNNKFKVAVPLLIIVSLIGMSIVYNMNNTSINKVPRILIHIDLVDQQGNILNEENTSIIAQVYAVAPPTMDQPLIEVYKGTLRTGLLELNLENKVFNDIVGAFVKKYEALAGNSPYALRAIKKFTEMINVNIWVIKDHKLVARLRDYLSYSPISLVNGDIIRYRIKVPISQDSSQAPIVPSDGPICEPGYSWRLKWWVGPENMTYNSDYMKYINGKPYLKWPILVVENTNQNSSTLNGSIIISSQAASGVYYSIGIGFQIESKLQNGSFNIATDLTLYKSSSMKSYVVNGGANFANLSYGQVFTYYIYGRPILEFWEEWFEWIGCPWRPSYPTGYQSVDAIVQDLSVVNVGGFLRYDGGVEYRWPYWLDRSLLFNYTFAEKKNFIVLNNTFREFYLSEFYSWYDTCDSSFEVSLTLLPLKLGLGDKSWAVTLTLIPVSFGYEDTRLMYINGLIAINSYYHNEWIYTWMSKFRWVRGTCEFHVPVFLYFESY